jgi:hypothetical protein
MKSMVSLNSILVVGRDQVSADLSPDPAGGVVVLGLKDGIYYELNEVGTSVWRLIQKPRSVQSIVDAMVEEYDVSPEECIADVVALAERLVKLGLIEIQSGDSG